MLDWLAAPLARVSFAEFSCCCVKLLVVFVYGYALSLMLCMCASQPKFQFSIRHYAGIVTYSSAGFVEKNKDQIHDEAADLVKLSSNRAMSQSYAFVEAAQRARSSASVCFACDRVLSIRNRVVHCDYCAATVIVVFPLLCKCWIVLLQFLQHLFGVACTCSPIFSGSYDPTVPILFEAVCFCEIFELCVLLFMITGRSIAKEESAHE